MDLLDSILNGMEKPPTIKRQEIKNKDKKEKLEKMARERHEAAKKQKETMNKFRDDITKRIMDFVNSPTTGNSNTFRLDLEPMSKLCRSIVHEACEDYEQDLIIHSFGTEEIDRHCCIWKKGYEPCDEEIRAMKLGVEYKPKANHDDDDDAKSIEDPVSSSKDEDGKDKFWSKYEKIIGENASGVASARAALPARQYGYVPIEKKKDQRSIEQMMDDMRKSKKQKTNECGSQSAKDNDGSDDCNEASCKLESDT